MQLRQEKGERLGADLSGVRFHSDADSLRRSDRIGARAWTQGNDVYFGEGGFDPAVAAHELVHTVQQGAVSGQVSQTAPAGTVQMMPHPFKWLANQFRIWRDGKSGEQTPETAAPTQNTTPPTPEQTRRSKYLARRAERRKRMQAAKE